MKIVHLLRYGQTLCQMAGTPNEWPENHWFVNDGHLKNVTCSDCFAAILPRNKPIKKTAAMKRTRVNKLMIDTPVWVDREHALHRKRQPHGAHALRRVEVTTINYVCECGVKLTQQKRKKR